MSLVEVPIAPRTAALSDLVKEEQRLQILLEDNSRRTDQLIEKFYSQWKTLDNQRNALRENLAKVRSEAADKVRLAQLLHFPPELSQWASLVTPAHVEDGSDASLLVKFGTSISGVKNDQVVAVLADLLRSATGRDRALRHRGVSLTALVDEKTGKLVSTRSHSKSIDRIDAMVGTPPQESPLGAAGMGARLRKQHHVDPQSRASASAAQNMDRISPRGPITAKELTLFESRLEKKQARGASGDPNEPRLNKVTQPFVLGDAAYVPYVQPYDEKTLDEKVRSRTHRYLRRFGSGEWAAGTSSALASAMAQLTLRLKRSALTEFVVIQAVGRGRVLCSARQHLPGELLFIDLANLSVTEQVKDNLLSPKLEESYAKVASKKELFKKFKTWDIRLVTMLLVYISQLASSAPLSRRSKRNINAGGSTNSVGSTANFFEKSELKKKIKDLCCPLNDMEPAKIDSLHKLAQIIHASLPDLYRKGENDEEASGKKKDCGASSTSDETAKVSVDDIVRLMVQFQCNCITHMSSTEGGAKLGGRSMASASRHPTGRSLFYTLSMVEHSCVPNSVVTHPSHLCDPETGLVEAEVRAIRKIEPAERLTISYIPPYLPVAVAKKRLRDSYLFDCSCPRCAGMVPDETRRFYRTVKSDGLSLESLAPLGSGGRWIVRKIKSEKENDQKIDESVDEATPEEEEVLTFEHPTVIRMVSNEQFIDGSNKLSSLMTETGELVEEGAAEEEKREKIRIVLSEERARLQRIVSQLRVSGAVPLISLPEKVVSSSKVLKSIGTSSDDDVELTVGESFLPSASHHSVSLSMLLLLRTLDAWLAGRGLRKADSGVAQESEREVAMQVTLLGIDYIQLLGAELGFEALTNLDALHHHNKTAADGTEHPVRQGVSGRAHHIGFFTSFVELVASISSRMLPMFSPSEERDTVQALKETAGALWALSFDLLAGVLRWSSTARCIRAQLFAADPERFLSHPTAAKEQRQQIATWYLPTIL